MSILKVRKYHLYLYHFGDTVTPADRLYLFIIHLIHQADLYVFIIFFQLQCKTNLSIITHDTYV